MYAPGRYVRAPSVSPDRESEGEAPGWSVRVSPGRLSDNPDISDSGEEDHFADYYVPTDEHQIEAELEARKLELLNVINELNVIRGRTAGDNSNIAGPHDEGSRSNVDRDNPAVIGGGGTDDEDPRADRLQNNPAVAIGRDAFMAGSGDERPPATSNEGAIRWDNIPPFPKNVPAAKMWEAWSLFIEDFQMVASLSNVTNPRRRVELLLVSMGHELKSITRAAKLRPDSDDDNCYENFVKNIGQFLKSMSDPAAEHEAFSNMVQQEGESAVYFHARLFDKVQLCGYSPGNEDHFIRAQLMKGLRNEKLKEAARTYGLDSNTIVTSATRAEAFQAETAQPAPDPRILAINSNHQDQQGQVKRKMDDRRGPMKRFKQEKNRTRQGRVQNSRRERCSKCFRAYHNDGDCPAAGKTCYTCGKLGHFAVSCRQREANSVEDAEHMSGPTNGKNEQVNRF